MIKSCGRRVLCEIPPAELILSVYHSLDPISRLCLRYTSRILYYSLTYTPFSELGSGRKFQCLVRQTRDSGSRQRERRKPLRPTHKDARRRSRIQLLQLLMKDDVFGQHTSICSACLAVHQNSLFLPQQLEENDDWNRQCLGHTGVVWICPHRELRYQNIASAPITANTAWECFSCESVYVTTRQCAESRVYFPLMRLSLDMVALPLVTEVSSALGSLGSRVPLCPHLTPTSRAVLNAYEYAMAAMLSPLKSQDNINHDGSSNDYFPEKGPLITQCDVCDTRFSFDIKRYFRNGNNRNNTSTRYQTDYEGEISISNTTEVDDEEGIIILGLTVKRLSPRDIKNATDPKWITHLVQRGELQEKWKYSPDGYKDAWMVAARACKRVIDLKELKPGQLIVTGNPAGARAGHVTRLSRKGHSGEDQSNMGNLGPDQSDHARAWHDQDEYIRKGFPLAECFLVSLYSMQ